MKVKVIGSNYYQSEFNGKIVDHYTIYYVRKPYESVFSEQDVKGMISGVVRGGKIFEGVTLNKCYDFVEAQTGSKDGKPVYSVVEVNEIANI